MNGTDFLQRLLAGLQAGRLPSDVLDRLEQGASEYLAGAGSLDACLGLKARPGKCNEHPPNAVRYARRDESVRRMARGLPGTPWHQAGVLAEIVADYDRLKTLDNRSLPPQHRMVCLYLADAEANGLPIPASQSQLARILAGRRD